MTPDTWHRNSHCGVTHSTVALLLQMPGTDGMMPDTEMMLASMGAGQIPQAARVEAVREEEMAPGGGAGGGEGGARTGRKKKKKKAAAARKLPTGRKYNGQQYGSPLAAQEAWRIDEMKHRGGVATPEMRAVQERLDKRDAPARKLPAGRKYNGQQYGSPLDAQEAWRIDEMKRRGGVATPEMRAVQERLATRPENTKKKNRKGGKDGKHKASLPFAACLACTSDEYSGRHTGSDTCTEAQLIMCFDSLPAEYQAIENRSVWIKEILIERRARVLAILHCELGSKTGNAVPDIAEQRGDGESKRAGGGKADEDEGEAGGGGGKRASVRELLSEALGKFAMVSPGSLRGPHE